MSCDLLHLLLEPLNGIEDGRTTNGQRAASVGATSFWCGVGITMQHDDLLYWNAELLCHDLCKGCLFALTMWRRASVDHHGTALLDTHTRTLIEANRSAPLRTKAANLNVGGDADAHQLSRCTFLRLLGTQVFIVRNLQCLLHSSIVVTSVIHCSGGRLVWELVGFDKVKFAYINWVLTQFVGYQVYSTFYDIGGLWTTGTAIGIRGRFVREDNIAAEVDVWDVIGTT